MNDVGGPLQGVKVLSMALMLPGPYCSMLLADLGADVIILEQPGVGDRARLLPDFFNAVNRNKKSVTVNLSSPQGQEIGHRLAAWADVATEGFRPGVAKQLRMDYDTLVEVNPRLIYASISGYGQDGPYRNRPGHDLSYQGTAGVLGAQLTQGTTPTVPPLPVADLSSAMFATIGITSALCNRERTGKGQYIDVSMTDGVVSWMSLLLVPTLQNPAGAMNLEGFGEPGYGVFETKDGKFITLSIATEDHFWRNLCNAIGREELATLSFLERAGRCVEMVNILKDTFLSKTRDEWYEVLGNADVAWGIAYTPSEVVNDPQLRHRGMFAEIDDPQRGKFMQVSHPLKFSQTPATLRFPPPELGQHTEEVLISLGYTKDEITQMRGGGVI
ncbi:MAG: CaiB/BaiF CoA-transferase family protein [Chloroflexota bacterium]|nr:CaiB/BaiF CoA-transferase family protein [Chloroflexota bacterium]